jgi:hypothetical protein
MAFVKCSRNIKTPDLAIVALFGGTSGPEISISLAEDGFKFALVL